MSAGPTRRTPEEVIASELLDIRYGWNRPHAGILEQTHNESARRDAERIAAALRRADYLFFRRMDAADEAANEEAYNAVFGAAPETTGEPE